MRVTNRFVLLISRSELAERNTERFFFKVYFAFLLFSYSFVHILNKLLFLFPFCIRVQANTYKHSICIRTQLFIHICYTYTSCNIARWKMKERREKQRATLLECNYSGAFKKSCTPLIIYILYVPLPRATATVVLVII